MLNLPNTLTILRLLVLPIIVYFMIVDTEVADQWALGLFIAAAITDFLDGWIARKFNQVSAFGTFLDPISDKIFVCVLLLTLVYTARVDLFGTVLIMIIFMREFMISGMREFLGPLKVKIPVSKLAKWKTTVQMLAVAALIISPSFGILQEIGLGLLIIAAIITVITAWNYLKIGFQHIKD